MRRDKLLVELILLLLLFLGLYVFSGEISDMFSELVNHSDLKPLQSLLWFLGVVFELFGNWPFLFISYLVILGIAYVIARRE